MLVLLAAVPAQAQSSPEVERGFNWLQSQVQADGSLIGETSSIANPLQTRSEALYTLKLLAAPSNIIVSLQTALGSDSETSTEYLARRAWALGYSGMAQPALIGQLEQRQNVSGTDGGYGGDFGYASQALDTAFVLLAQKASATAATSAVTNALAYLGAAKAADGSFATNQQSGFYVTVKSLLAAAAWSDQASTGAITAPAQQWLLAQRNAAQHFGNAFDNAMALWALTGQTSQASILQPLVDALKADQLANGSWNDDPYLTAIALRALFLVTQTPPAPTTAAIHGMVVDGGSVNPLAGVTVQIITGVQAGTTTGAGGGFDFAGVTPGTLTLRFSKLGYAGKDLAVTLAAGQNLNLGTIAMAQASLTASLSGVVKNQSGTPLRDMTVAVGTASALTNNLGAYQIADLSPGTATITISGDSYKTVSATVNFAAGASYTFSPSLTATGSTSPSTTSLSGAVVDAETKQALVGANVQLGGASRTTGTGGVFTFNPTTAGEFVLTVSASGYQTVSASGVAAQGANDIGKIGLVRLPASSTLSGTIIDAVTAQPVSAASVSVQGQSSPVTTAADGKYSIGGLNGTSFTLNVSASGYLSQSQSIALTQTGSAVVDVTLHAQGTSDTDVSFIKVATPSPSYPASGVIPLELLLANNVASSASVQVSAQVFNTQNSIVHEYLASPVIGWQGVAYGNNPVTVAANSTLELFIDWNTLRLPAGEYSIKARAVDGAGRVVAEGDTSFTVNAEAILAGGVTADPPLAQAGASTPISLTADLTNNGNVTLPPGDLQLRITLDTPDATENTQVQASLRTFVAGTPMQLATKLVVDGQGNLYTVNSSDGKVIKIDPSGMQSILATLPFISFTDLALDGQGNIWVATLYQRKLYKISVTGEVTALPVSSLTQIYALGFSEGGMMFLSGSFSGSENGKHVNENRLVQRDSNGIETVLWRDGLVSPVAMVKDNAGNYVVTNSGDGTLTKVSTADGLVTPFVAGLSQPKGITADAAGNFYVANAGNNMIVKVTPEGQTSVYATGFNQPYDLKFDGAGNLFVSNAGDDSILKVLPGGNVQLFAKGVANGPQGMKYDADGNLWIANDDGTLRKKDPQDNTSIVVTGLSSPRGVAITDNGDVLVAEYSSGKVIRISNSAKSTFASGLSGPYGIALDDTGNVYVTELGSNIGRIARFDAAGNKLGITESVLVGPTKLRATPNGDVYIQNNGFLSVHSGGTVQIALRNFSNYTSWTPDPVNGGFVALSGTSVVRVSAAGAVTTIKSSFPFHPYALALDSLGNIILQDYSNKKLQKLDSNGNVTELVTLPTYSNPNDLQNDPAGNVIVRLSTGAFYRVSTSGGLSLIAHSVPDYIQGWSAASNGQIIAWAYSGTYRIDSATGATTVWLANRGYYTNGQFIIGAAVDGAGNLLLTDTNSQNLSVYSANGIELNQVHGFAAPFDIIWSGSELRFVDSISRLYGFTGNAYPRKKAGSMPVRYLVQIGSDTLGASSSDSIYKWTGTGSTGYDVYASIPGALTGIAAKDNGEIAVAINPTSRVVVLDAAKTIIKDYAGLRTPQGLAFDNAGRLYVANYSGGTVARFDSLTNPSTSTFTKTTNPQYLAFDTAGQLLVAKSNGVDRIATNGIATAVTSDGSFKGLLVDGMTVLAVDQSNGQLRKLSASAGNNTWNVFAAGIAKSVAVRAASNGDVFVLSQTNNTVVKYSAGKLDTVAAVPAGMNALDIAANGVLTVAGNSGVVNRVTLDGTVTDLRIGSLANQWPLTGVADVGNGKVYVMANDSATQSGSVFELSVTQPVTPPSAGSVVYQTKQAMAAMPANGTYEHFDFGTWVPPYGGDFKVELWRDGIDGKATNFIHVGPHAQSLLTAAKTLIPPGDSALPMCLDVKGADFTAISRVEMGQVRPVSKSAGFPKGMAGDRDGNVYITDATALYRTNAEGQNTLIAGGMSLAFGLATDTQQNFYVASKKASTGRYELIRIDLQGVKTVVADLGVTSANGVQVNSKDEVLVGSPNKLLKVDQQGAVTVVTTTGLPSPRGIAVDGRDNVYVQNESDFVSMIKPDGSSLNIFSKSDGIIDPRFEGDGYPNIAADCADNFYIAPFQWAKINQVPSEEHSIAQVVPRTGRIALLFDTQKISSALNDIDYLAFDRFSNRVLMWNHGDSRIWQVPVTCGAIGVQAHLLAKPGQTLTGASKPPSATVPRADGRTEYVWSMSDVTAQGSQICFDASQLGVQLGEERKAIDSGFISFQNSFASGDVTVPLSIPLVRAANLVSLNVATDRAEYPANANAQVSVVLTNANTSAVTGTLSVQVFDSQGVMVGNVTQQGVTLPANNGLPVTAVFDIGAIIPAQYTVKAVLNGANGDLARAQSVFNVLASNSSASAKSTVATDRQLYNASDRVSISSRVANQSANIILDNLTLMVQVVDATGAMQFSAGHSVPQLMPGASRDYAAAQTLSNMPQGSYTVRQTLSDSQGRTLNQVQAAYTVQSSANTGFGLTGSVTSALKQVQIGETLSLTANASNAGNSALADLLLKVSIVDPASQQIIAEFPYTYTLNVGETYHVAASWQASGTVGTTYVAVLSAAVGGKTLTLGQDTFTLSAPPIKLDIAQNLSAGSRVLVLVSCKDGTQSDTQTDSGTPCETARSQAIRQALTELAVPHTIVTDETAFKRALRSGIYNTYWISGKEDKLHDDLPSEVREAVFSGDGFISDSMHDQRNKVLDTAAGITYHGKTGETGLEVELTGPLFEAQRLVTVDRALRLDPDGSTVQAQLYGKKAESAGPAILTNAYGAGRAVTFAFDLAMSMQAQPLWKPVLATSLKHVMPANPATVTPGSLLSVYTSIGNLAKVVDVAISSVLPQGASYLASSPTGTYDAEINTIGWAFTLAEAQTREVFLTMRVPPTAGDFTLQTRVSTTKNGTSSLYGDPLALSFTVTPAATMAANATAKLTALALSQKKDQKLRDSLVSQLQQAMSAFQQNTAAGYETAIAGLMQVVDSLGGLTAVDTTAVRHDLDRILKEAQWRWTVVQPAQ